MYQVVYALHEVRIPALQSDTKAAASAATLYTPHTSVCDDDSAKMHVWNQYGTCVYSIRALPTPISNHVTRGVGRAFSM